MYTGIEHFAYDTDSEKPDGLKSKKTRQLYNVSNDTDEQEESQDTGKSGTNVMYLFGHLFDTCQEATINMALTTGFCRLILGGHYETSELISKIVLKFFNPTTCTEINQILSVFFETLIQRGKQACLEKALLPTVSTILDAPHESALREIKPDSVVKFVINSTMPCPMTSGTNIHNTIARSFLKHMHEHISNKELLKILSKELQTLEIDPNPSVREELKELAESLLAESINDSKIEGYIKTFIELLSGALTKRSRSTVNLEDAGSDDDQSVDENVERTSVEENVQSGGLQSTSQPVPMGKWFKNCYKVVFILFINHLNFHLITKNIFADESSISSVPSISSSIFDQTKNHDDTDVPEPVQNNNDSDEENNTTTSSANKSASKGRGRKSAQSQNTKDKRSSKLTKDLPDENENCRVSAKICH